VRVPFRELRRETEELRAELTEAHERVLDSGVFVGGPEVESFEEKLAGYCGATAAVGVASGTDALEMSLRAVGVGPGDEVITAANTFVPTVAAIVATGATPVLADVDPETFTLDPESAARACGPRTRALVPVHLYGHCAELRPLLALARDRGLTVVDDAAQALGAEWDGRRVGGLCDATAFSFYPTKNLGALGDGGAVTTNDPELAERVRRLCSYGERTRYDAVEWGRNSRLDSLQAAVLRAKLPHLERWGERRRELAVRYTRRLAELQLATPAEAGGTCHAWHLYVARVPARDALREALHELGVETLVHYPRAVHEQPAYAALARPELGRSERLAREVVSLPLYPQLTDGEAEYVCDALAQVAS